MLFNRNRDLPDSDQMQYTGGDQHDQPVVYIRMTENIAVKQRNFYFFGSVSSGVARNTEEETIYPSVQETALPAFRMWRTRIAYRRVPLGIIKTSYRK
jgi:hypothetical protein